MQKIRKGDDVIIIAGKDKGKRGAVMRTVGEDRVLVQGINTVKKHQKPNPTIGNAGGIIDREMSIHISNVAIYNFISKKSDRVGVIVDNNNNKVRIFKSTGDLIKT
ncbi:ribosomal protein L24 [Nitrosomonas sp. Is79A3]|uniref:50S ribosomal protein L24 n=1 Tax=Nitrosomonas sp. (strain Is79A3) TaxID=261292 RepID=UPI000215D31B